MDDSVEVTDSLAGTLGTVTSADPSPKEFTYAKVVEGTTGTCTDVNNTATFTTNTTKTTGTDSQDVRLCVGADLTVSKTATPTFTRTYLWKISKSVNKTLVQQQGGSAIFNYTVKAEQSGVADSAWAVSGKVTVTNPNDWQDIVVDVTDAIDNGAAARLRAVEPPSTCPHRNPSSSITPARMPLPESAAGTNTATATWNAATSYTPTGTANGTAPVAFTTPTTTVNKTITVTDTFNGGTASTLGYVTATDAEPYASKTFTYPRTISNTTGGQCQAYDNTATITQTSQSDSETVTICNTATGGKTIGFWQNPNGQAIIKGGYASSGVCNSGTWLRGLLPFQDLSATATCSQVATYATNVIKAANASGTAMNAMLKAQMLATALDVYFSDPALGGNKIGAAQPIGGVKIDLTSVQAIGSSSYQNTSAAFGGASCRTVVQLLADAALQSNAGGSVWYGQVKATQELAKDTFDAINNQVAWIAPTCP